MTYISIVDGVRITVYRSKNCALVVAPSVFVYFHGGGNVVGSRKTVDTVCKIFSRYGYVMNILYVFKGPWRPLIPFILTAHDLFLVFIFFGGRGWILSHAFPFESCNWLLSSMLGKCLSYKDMSGWARCLAFFWLYRRTQLSDSWLGIPVLFKFSWIKGSSIIVNHFSVPRLSISPALLLIDIVLLCLINKIDGNTNMLNSLNVLILTRRHFLWKDFKLVLRLISL